MADEIDVIINDPRTGQPREGRIRVAPSTTRGDVDIMRAPTPSIAREPVQPGMESFRQQPARVQVGDKPRAEAIWENAKRAKAEREATALSKQDEARAAIAMMKEQEGRRLTTEEAGALEMAKAWSRANSIRREVGESYKAVSQRNPMFEGTREHIGATREAQGNVMAGQVAQYEAGLQSARDIEAFQARVSLEDEMVSAGIAAKEEARMSAMDEAQQAVKEAQRLVAEAAEKFNRTPGIDPNRLWANKTAGQKFGAAILSIVGARAGVVLPGSFQAIQQSIQDDIQSQKDNIGLAQAKFGALAESFQSQTQAYSSIRAAVNDERTADMIYERARMEQAEREFQWWMQKGQVAQMSAGQQTFLGQIQQAKADLDLQLQQRAVNNPKRFTRVVSTMRPWERKAALDRADKYEDFGMDLAKEAQKQGGTMRLESAKAQIEAQAKAGEREDKLLRGEGGIYRESAQYADKYGEIDGAIRLIDEMLKQEDIAGYVNIPGAGRTPQSQLGIGEAGQTEKQIDLFLEALGRVQSQGAITKEELVNFSDYARGGTKWGGEDKLRDNLSRIRTMLNAKRETGLKARSPEAQQYILKNTNIPTWDPEFVDSVLAAPVVNVHE